MRKNLHHKIMLSILAGSLALGFIYAPPAFAEEDVTIKHGANVGNGSTYNLDAKGTTDGTNYGDEKGYTSISLPTGPIGTFTVIAGNGGTAEKNGSTGGKGGSISLSDIKNAITNGVSITAGSGGHSLLSTSTGGAGGDVTLTFKETVTGIINATGGNGGNIENSAAAMYLTGGNGGDVILTFNDVVTDNITATAGNGSNIENSAAGGIYTGGNGGNVTLTFNETVTDNITATAGNGSNIENLTAGGILRGGNGGNATLTFNYIVVTDNISLTSGMNGTGNGANSTPGNGGSVNFTANSISGTQSTDNINITLNKNDGALNFHTNTLNIQNNTVTITANGSIGDGQSQDNHIDTLLLTGNGNFITNLSNNADITVGKLAIDGGTVNDANWDSIIERNYRDPYAANITLGANGVTFDIASNKTLAKNLTGSNPGNLTKTGAGTLKLTGSTYDYTGLTSQFHPKLE